MLPHDVFMHLDLLDVVPQGGPQRRLIMDFVRRLRDNPDTPGDFTDKDAAFRERQIKIVGDYAVTYWADAAVRAVMVVDIRPAGG